MYNLVCTKKENCAGRYLEQTSPLAEGNKRFQWKRHGDKHLSDADFTNNTFCVTWVETRNSEKEECASSYPA
jgi:hypothetical protein